MQKLSWTAVLPVLIIAALACSSEENQSSDVELNFQQAVRAGKGCPELFEIRNSRDVSESLLASMTDELRRVGCYSSTSSRTDISGDPSLQDASPIQPESERFAEPPANDGPLEYSREQYRIPYDNCAWDVSQVYDESGTRDAIAAAEWYAEVFFGSAAKGAYDGCLDALQGKSPRY